MKKIIKIGNNINKKEIQLRVSFYYICIKMGQQLYYCLFLSDTNN